MTPTGVGAGDLVASQQLKHIAGRPCRERCFAGYDVALGTVASGDVVLGFDDTNRPNARQSPNDLGFAFDLFVSHDAPPSEAVERDRVPQVGVVPHQAMAQIEVAESENVCCHQGGIRSPRILAWATAATHVGERFARRHSDH